MIEHQAAVVNTIEAHLDSHVFNEDALARLHLIITDPDDKAIDALVLAVDYCLGKYDCIVSMACTIRDPELLRKSGR